MIVFVSGERFVKLGDRLRNSGRPDLRRRIRTLTYEELLFERAGPVAHYIFTDFDRLTRYEIESVMRFVSALKAVAPEAKILNHPMQVLERTPLLVALNRAGLNDFEVVRIDTGARPTRYPVFLRSEDGFGGPETDLIHDDAAYDAAIAALAARGLPTKGRIAVGYAAEPGPDGYFRKYGCFNVAGEIVAYHVHRQKGWVVKNLAPGETRQPRRRGAPRVRADGLVEEEFEYVKSNPHREHLRKAFAIAGIDYGRADYAIVNGRVQIYEINTNPNVTGGRSTTTGIGLERRALLTEAFDRALRGVDTPIGIAGRVHFAEARPRVHRIHLPRARLPASLLRRAADRLGYRRVGAAPPRAATEGEENT